MRLASDRRLTSPDRIATQAKGLSWTVRSATDAGVILERPGYKLKFDLRGPEFHVSLYHRGGNLVREGYSEDPVDFIEENYRTASFVPRRITAFVKRIATRVAGSDPKADPEFVSPAFLKKAYSDAEKNMRSGPYSVAVPFGTVSGQNYTTVETDELEADVSITAFIYEFELWSESADRKLTLSRSGVTKDPVHVLKNVRRLDRKPQEEAEPADDDTDAPYEKIAPGYIGDVRKVDSEEVTCPRCRHVMHGAHEWKNHTNEICNGFVRKLNEVETSHPSNHDTDVHPKN